MKHFKAAAGGIIMRLTAALLSLFMLAAASGCALAEIFEPIATPELTDGPDVTAYATDVIKETASVLNPEEIEFWKKANELADYYEEVALRSEYGDMDGKVHKWAETIRFYAFPSEDLVKYENYIRDFIGILNGIEGFPGIVFAESADEADLTLQFVSAAEMERKTGSIGESAFGFAEVSWYNNTCQIFKGSVYIVREADSSEDDIKHTILEETTQAMGLMNDSDRFPDSIFYQGYSTVSSLSEEDMVLLRMHYSGYISEGMDAGQVREVAERLANS